MARDGVWEVWIGMWISSFVLAPLGAFLTYKAANDSVLLNADTYFNSLKNLLGKKVDRKIERNDVIIYTPNYDKMYLAVTELNRVASNYLAKHRHWTNYIKFWRKAGQNEEAESLSAQLDQIVEELSNSDKILVLNKLMDYPVLSGYDLLRANLSPKIGFALGLFLPIGLPIYLIAIYQRKLLKIDIKQIEKTSAELIEILGNEK